MDGGVTMVHMKARFEEKCAKCHRPIAVGAQIARPYGKAPWHMGCALAYQASRRQVITASGRRK